LAITFFLIEIIMYTLLFFMRVVNDCLAGIIIAIPGQKMSGQAKKYSHQRGTEGTEDFSFFKKRKLFFN